MQIIIIAVIALIAGIIIGRMISSRGASAAHTRELEDELIKARKDLDEYKDQVTVHFTHTAELVNNLTNSYREVHNHLAGSAEKLCNSEQLLTRIDQPLLQQSAAERVHQDAVDGRSLDDLADTLHSDDSIDQLHEEEAATGTAAAPKDYAPKTAGTLAEGYGLNDNDEQTTEYTEDKHQAAKQ